jgi:low molecular weight phosphotyrosine protein phosphatase
LVLKLSCNFLILGNICRSPMAEIVMRKLVENDKNWIVDSAGTGSWHIGESPDSRTLKVCKQHYKDGFYAEHKARQVCAEDFVKFDYILCMDEENLADLKAMEKKIKNKRAVVKLLGEYDPEGEKIVSDPYYGGDKGFEHNFQQVTRCCKAFIKSVQK